MATVLETANAPVPLFPSISSPAMHDDPDFRQALENLLPETVSCHSGPIDTLQAPLHDIEARSVQGAVEKRVREFTAGRTCARIALQGLGIDDASIPVGKRRQPVWPAGITGSISHANDYCVAAVSSRQHFSGLGVDIEQATPLSESLVDLVCSKDEQDRLRRFTESSAGLLAKFAFSAKEAVFKCLFPIYGEELEFHDVSLDISLNDGRYAAHVSRFALNSDEDLELHGRITCTSRFVITLAVLQDDDILHLTGWNPGMRLENCEGRFICGT